MPRKLPPNVERDRSRHGKLRFYYRKGKGKCTRLPDPNDLEFEAAYLAAISNRPPPQINTPNIAHGTLSWLIDRYRESSTWANLSNATRRQRENIFKDTITRSQNIPLSKVNRASLQAAIESRAATPAQANNFLKAMRGLFKWANQQLLIPFDPTIELQRVAYKTDGFPTWTIEDARAFRNYWREGTMERLAFELFLVTGIRRGDMHRAGRQHLRGNTFTLATEKTGAVVSPVFPETLMRLIEQTPSGHMQFLVSSTGKPFGSKESFGNWFGKAARAAGIEKNAHGIRKLAATLIAEAGGTSHELMSHFGWADLKEAELYTRGADRKRLSISSSARIAEQIQTNITRTQVSGEGKVAK